MHILCLILALTATCVDVAALRSQDKTAREDCELDYAQTCSIASPIAAALNRYSDEAVAHGPAATARGSCKHKIVLVKEDETNAKCQKPERFETEVAPSAKEVARFGKRGYKSCAVVGGSAQLLDCNMGREIDEHEAVFRCNGSPTQGFEDAVGKRETVRLVNVNCHPEQSPIKEAEIKIKIDGWVDDRDFGRSWYISPYTNTLAAEVTHSIAPADRRGWGWGKSRSCGNIAIMVALQSCKRVDIYGFGPQEGVYTYYFDRNKKIWSGHGMAQEQEWYHCLNAFDPAQPELIPDVCRPFVNIMGEVWPLPNFTMRC